MPLFYPREPASKGKGPRGGTSLLRWPGSTHGGEGGASREALRPSHLGDAVLRPLQKYYSLLAGSAQAV